MEGKELPLEVKQFPDIFEYNPALKSKSYSCLLYMIENKNLLIYIYAEPID
jgi:hypothetical protein